MIILLIVILVVVYRKIKNPTKLDLLLFISMGYTLAYPFYIVEHFMYPVVFLYLEPYYDCLFYLWLIAISGVVTTLLMKHTDWRLKRMATRQQKHNEANKKREI